MIEDPISQIQLSFYCQTYFSELLIVKDSQKGVESILKKSKANNTHLQNQLQILSQLQEYEGFPKLLSHEKDSDGNIVSLRIQKLGTSLKSLMMNCKGSNVTIPMDMIVNISMQIIQRIQSLHSNGYMHLDIKPEHFLFQTQSIDSRLYLIDFGLSTKKKDCLNQFTSQSTKTNVFKGNVKYSSISSMQCFQSTIYDDLQSILYVIGEMLQGQLPWKFSHLGNKKQSFKDSYPKILSKKMKQDWKKYKTWMIQTNRKIRKSSDPYYQFRTQVYRLFQISH